jgi:hypothetical protein
MPPPDEIDTHHLDAWLLEYRDAPEVIVWLQTNKPPFGFRPENAVWAYMTMPGAKDWPVDFGDEG